MPNTSFSVDTDSEVGDSKVEEGNRSCGDGEPFTSGGVSRIRFFCGLLVGVGPSGWPLGRFKSCPLPRLVRDVAEWCDTLNVNSVLSAQFNAADGKISLGASLSDVSFSEEIAAAATVSAI